LHPGLSDGLSLSRSIKQPCAFRLQVSRHLFLQMSSRRPFRNSHHINAGGGDKLMGLQLSQSTNPIVHLTFFARTNGERFCSLHSHSGWYNHVPSLVTLSPVTVAHFYMFLILLPHRQGSLISSGTLVIPAFPLLLPPSSFLLLSSTDRFSVFLPFRINLNL
jgi:hypothetical protein